MSKISKGRKKKHNTHNTVVVVVEDSTRREREERREERAKKKKKKTVVYVVSLSLPSSLPLFFGRRRTFWTTKERGPLIEIVTPHDYTIICAQRESTKRARERAKEREKRGEEDGLLLFLSRASFVGSRKRRTPWQTRRI